MKSKDQKDTTKQDKPRPGLGTSARLVGSRTGRAPGVTSMKKFATMVVVMISMVSMAGFAPAAELDEQTQQALLDALQDEYKAQATYQKVMDQFGEIRPFANIIKAEEQHIEELLPLFEKYGVAVPENDWYAKIPEFESVQAACEAGVEAEIENAKMYDEFFSFVQEADIIEVFTNLRDASQDKHLPAFERCADRGSGQGSGRGEGQGRGNGNGQGRK